MKWFLPGCKFKIVVRSFPRAVTNIPLCVCSPVYLLVLLYNGWLDRYWISNPKIVQSLSNAYPMLVQSKSKSKVYPVLVQHLSNKMYCCPMIDQIKSRSSVLWTKSWHRLDNRVWTKIGLRLDCKYFHLMINILWTKSGLTLDLDYYWTNLGPGQSLDYGWTETLDLWRYTIFNEHRIIYQLQGSAKE